MLHGVDMPGLRSCRPGTAPFYMEPDSRQDILSNRHEKRTRIYTPSAGMNGGGSGWLQILSSPLVNAVQSLLQILERIRDAEAQVAFAVLPEGGTGKGGNAGLLQQGVRQGF
jgi:hypothetical protein